MKKIKYILVLSLLLCFCFCGCKNKNSSIIDKASELAENYFFCKAEEFEVEIVSGKRELDFEYDGVSTEKVEYGIIKISFYKDVDYENLAVELSIDENTQEYDLEKNPFDDSYMVDICKNIDENVCISLSFNQYQNVKVKCMSNDWGASSAQILKQTSNELNYFFKNQQKNNKDFECYVRVVKYNTNKPEFFYSVLIKTQDFKSVNLLFNVNGDLLVKSQSN